VTICPPNSTVCPDSRYPNPSPPQSLPSSVPPSPQSSGSKTLSTGAVTGLSIGAPALLGVFALGVVCLLHRWRRPKVPDSQEPPKADLPSEFNKSIEADLESGQPTERDSSVEPDPPAEPDSTTEPDPSDEPDLPIASSKLVELGLLAELEAPNRAELDTGQPAASEAYSRPIIEMPEGDNDARIEQELQSPGSRVSVNMYSRELNVLPP
jgi:hypothetical protein